MTDTQTPATIPATDRAALALGRSETEKHLAALATKHASITEVKDKTGREQAHGAYMELARARTTVEKAAKDARDDATKFSKAVIAEAARLVAIVEPEETRLKAVRDAWDDEQERIKQEAVRIERERLLKITERIAAIKGYSSTVMGCRTAERATELLCKLHAVDMTGFAEFEAEAARAHLDAITAVAQHRDALAAREAEAERLKVERAELARQQEEAKQKADELAAQQKAEADKLAAERAEFARQQQEAAEKLAAQQAEIERQRAELEAAKAREQEEAARKVQEAAEEMARKREQAEADRIRAEQNAIAAAEIGIIAAPAQYPDAEKAAENLFGSGTNALSTMSFENPAGTLILSSGPAAVIPLKVGECGTTEDDDRRLTLGQLNFLLAPISISATGMAELGFEPAERVKNSCLYRHCDVPRICAAITEHLRELASEMAAA